MFLQDDLEFAEAVLNSFEDALSDECNDPVLYANLNVIYEI